MKKVKLPTVKCKKCGYEWKIRTGSPKKCPSCQSWDWNEPTPVYRRKAGKK